LGEERVSIASHLVIDAVATIFCVRHGDRRTSKG